MKRVMESIEPVVVFIVRNNDPYTEPERILFSPDRHRTLDEFIAGCNRILPLREGTATTLYDLGGNMIPDQSFLEHGETYVLAGGCVPFHYVDYPVAPPVTSMASSLNWNDTIPFLGSTDAAAGASSSGYGNASGASASMLNTTAYAGESKVSGGPSSSSLRRGLVILVYKNGSPYFPGLSLTLHPKKYKTLHVLLGDLSTRMDLPWGARRLYAYPSGDRITRLSHLVNNGLYVAAGNEAYKDIEYILPSPVDNSDSLDLDAEGYRDVVVIPDRLRPATPEREWRNTSTYRRRG